MSLFQKSVEKKYLNDLDSTLIDSKYIDFQNYFGNQERQENIRNSKEEQFQEGFLRELFVNILGYTLNPEPNFNLTTELKNIANSKKADGAILKGEDAIAVIELKSTNTTDLDSIEIQAFGYKNHHPKCVYVITSNFEKLRFYIQNAVDHIDFDLFNLTKEQFSLMWLCLSKDNLINDLPLNIKESSVLQEENITKKLYTDYSKFREAIYNNLVKNNPDTDKLLLFKKTQKLLDRFLFIFFAEDRLLLPPNSISEIVKQWVTLKDELDEYVPLYDRFKKYFGYMNTGFKGKKYDIYPYNGGLFAPDEILDSVSIDDDILHEHTLNLSLYDFETEVDVNILGHIFEHSLGEIENVQAEIKGEKNDSQKTKRKKDGIFYTPKYITKYIVENTVGNLCEEKRKELDIIDEEYAKGRKNRKKNTIKALDEKLTSYRDWLLTLTILDPACGSGAFLIQALEFLITEHNKIDDLRAQLFGGGIVFSDIIIDILEKNIYGVDLNEESVEIAKLSLWLRTAQKGRKLNTLSNNIKCGNSLINDSEIAGEKAFDWQNEFPEIFANGGFDVVIGNPPYVRHELITNIKSYLTNNYSSFQSIADLYVYFIEKGVNLLKSKGLLGFITPNKFITATYGKQIRIFLSKIQIIELIDFGELPVFEDAATFPLISIISKSDSRNNTNYTKIQSLKNLVLSQYVVINSVTIDKETFESDEWLLVPQNEKRLFNKIKNIGTPLSKYLNAPFYRGILTGFNEAFIIDEITKEKLINEDNSAKEIIKPFVDGDDVRKHYLGSKGKYLIFTRRGIDIEKYPSIKKHLLQFYEDLKPKKHPTDKKGRKKGDYQWYEIQDSISYFEEFDKSKIIYPEIAMSSRFTLDEAKTYLNKTIFLIPSNDKSLLAILNSKLIWFYLVNICTSLGDPKNGGRLNLQKVYLETIPIIKPSDTITKKLSELATIQLEHNSTLQNNIAHVLDLITTKYSIDKLSNKLKSWNLLDSKEFLKELKKLKIELDLSDESDWFQFFNNEKAKTEQLITNIYKTEQEIDHIVYDLYSLNDKEIKIVEEGI